MQKESVGCLPVSPNPGSPKPISSNPGKVHSTSKCIFCGKNHTPYFQLHF